MKVLLVSPVGSHGGGEEVLLQLAARLPRRGITAALACLRPGPLVGLARARGVEVHVFNHEFRYRNLLMAWRSARWLCSVVQSTSSTVVHSNHAAHAIASVAARMAGVPELWHIHDYPYKRDLLDSLLQFIPADYVVFTTDRVRSGYPALHEIPHSVIPPVCVEPGVVEHSRKGDVRARYGLEGRKIFLTVSRLQKHKAIHNLIEAAPAILKEVPDAVFVIAGGAVDREQEMYRKELNDLVEARGLELCVRMLGYVPEWELTELYASATALIHPAVSEGFGLVILEAMAAGVLVIAADADGPREIISHGETGLLFDKGSCSALAEAVIGAVAAPAISDRISIAGKKSVRRFSVQQMVGHTATVYEALAAKCGERVGGAR